MYEVEPLVTILAFPSTRLLIISWADGFGRSVVDGSARYCLVPSDFLIYYNPVVGSMFITLLALGPVR